jgi:hypothetical protein
VNSILKFGIIEKARCGVTPGKSEWNVSSSPALSPISGLSSVSNTLQEPEQIIPDPSSLALPFSDRFNYTFPATGVTTISLQTKTALDV